MISELVSWSLVLVSGFISAGLIFAMVKRRQRAGDYLLFWLNPFGQRTKRFIRIATFQGTAAELSRIVLFSAVTLIGVGGLLQD